MDMKKRIIMFFPRICKSFMHLNNIFAQLSVFLGFFSNCSDTTLCFEQTRAYTQVSKRVLPFTAVHSGLSPSHLLTSLFPLLSSVLGKTYGCPIAWLYGLRASRCHSVLIATIKLLNSKTIRFLSAIFSDYLENLLLNTHFLKGFDKALLFFYIRVLQNHAYLC